MADVRIRPWPCWPLIGRYYIIRDQIRSVETVPSLLDLSICRKIIKRHSMSVLCPHTKELSSSSCVSMRLYNFPSSQTVHFRLLLSTLVLTTSKTVLKVILLREQEVPSANLGAPDHF